MTMTNVELENEINALKTKLTALQGTVSNKADTTAVNALTTRVTSVEGVNTSQSNSITTLSNGLSSVQTRVTVLENK
ncbi:hypothetical protein [Acinetobacter pittii]|uniref:hypothetical protein n=1 Tax=Acinetobacter pittii TaxID=48296 RepID=UPI0032B33299